MWEHKDFCMKELVTMAKANRSNRLITRVQLESVKTVKDYSEGSCSLSVLKLSPNYVFKKAKGGKIP